MATACLSPLSSKIGQSCHFHSLAHSFLKWWTDRWWLLMPKNLPNAPFIDTPTSCGPILERRVTRRGKCIYTVWIQPFPLLPEKLFNTRKAACELLMAVLFAVTWIMGRQAWHMYPPCSVHWVMQAEMPHISHVFLLSRFFFLLLFSFFPLLTWCQQASPWTRMVWFISLMALRSERWTRTASSPLSLVPTT